MGNLIPVKGADRLPAIFWKIKEKCKVEPIFVIVGQGVLEGELREKLKGLPVTFTGQLLPDKLSEVYSHMDVLVVPSRSEGYSCVIKEAQACGVIPVGNDAGGIREAVGRYGSVVASPDEKELAECLAREACGYLEGKLAVNLDEMAKEAQGCSWVKRQEQSLLNYERIRKESSKVNGNRQIHSQ